MKTVAVYRILYGEDYIRESLESIYPFVDKILILFTDKVWKEKTGVVYFGHEIIFPHAFDNVRNVVAKWKTEHDPEDKIVIEEDYFNLPCGQLTHIINKIVMPRWNPDVIMYVEPDEVWKQSNLQFLFNHIGRCPSTKGFCVCRIEFWKSHKHAFRYYSWRQRFYIFNNTSVGGQINRKEIGNTNNGGNELHCRGLLDVNKKDGERHVADVHHFAYACSPRTVFWKHLTGLAFSPGIDSMPCEDWYDRVWRPWQYTPDRVTSLCPSRGYERNIPDVEPYPFEELPEAIQKRVNNDKN